jgi:hypothetical protein
MLLQEMTGSIPVSRTRVYAAHGMFSGINDRPRATYVPLARRRLFCWAVFAGGGDSSGVCSDPRPPLALEEPIAGSLNLRRHVVPDAVRAVVIATSFAMYV